jgi:uncharacterized protein (DUF2147 family)
MMNKIFFVVIAMGFAVLLLAFTKSPDDILGLWITQDKDYKIQISKNGEKYSGILIWSKNLYESDGKMMRKDINNPEEVLRNRVLLNIELISNLVYEDKVWKDGDLYDPESGNTYHCSMKMNAGALEVKSYIGSPILGRTTVWIRP